MVGVDKRQAFVDRPRQVEIVFVLHKLHVDLMLHPAGNTPLFDLFRFAGLIAVLRFIDHPFPGITFLAAHKLIGAVARMIGRPTVSPVVFMVGNQMGMNALFLEYFRHRVVERLQRRPPTM